MQQQQLEATSLQQKLLLEYQQEGCLFPINPQFSHKRMGEIDEILTDAVTNRPEQLKPEDLLNMHLTDQSIFDLCREPSSLHMAQLLLGTKDISIFTSRMLCKMPGTGQEIP
jgi:hypothetical protein